ncbi:chondroitin proteoglycan 2-like [Cottoperca gobio]|uniref:chitinase n=1 Tax=Cottoperca gobio TaxID=56716 RepID=A0A6J2Q0H8_COTGO|nr:chondroitin proteoglycan 2-like [Cottoperca gobio]
MSKLTVTAGLCLIIASLATTGLADTPVPFCNGKDPGFYANAADPHCFYNCYGATTFLEHCSAGLVFNQVINNCDYPQNTGTFCVGKDDGQYSNTADPHSFYNCGGKRTFLQYCPPGLIFNEEDNCCGYPKSSTPTNTGTFCVRKTDGRYVNLNDPTSFYECLNQITYNNICTTGLVFKQTCGPPKLPSTNSCTANNGHFANANDPTTFFNCGNGKCTIQKCSAGLIFKQSCTCCDHP